MADDTIAPPSWTAQLKKIDSPVEERNLSVGHERFAEPGVKAGVHINNVCKHFESCESDLEGADFFRRGNLVNTAENGYETSVPATQSGNNGDCNTNRVFEKKAGHHCDVGADNTFQLIDNNIQNFMRFQHIDLTLTATDSQDLLRDALFRSNSSSPSTARVAEDIYIKTQGLSRAHSAKERPGPTEYLGDPHYLRGHRESWKTTLARTRSASMIGDTTLKTDRAAGLIKKIFPRSEILERSLRYLGTFGSDTTQANHYSPNGDLPNGRSPGTEQALDQDLNTREDVEMEPSPVEEVALIVPTTDDPSIAVWTFRTIVLGVFSCALITFLNTYFSYRSEPIVITVTTVLIITAPLGNFMASVLPNKLVRLPGTQRGFSINPGPFNMKEHTLITIFASSGAVRPGGIFVLNMIRVFFNGHIGFLPAFMVTLTCEFIGYSWAILLQKFLVDPARMWWPGSLVAVSLVRGLNRDVTRSGFLSPIQFFLVFFIVASAYYVVPGFFIPSISTVSVVCLIFKHSVRAQQLGSGSSGLGLGAVSFNWATIAGFLGSPLVVPWGAVANIALGVVIQSYLVVPLTYWNNWYTSKNYPIFSSAIFTRSGQPYDVSQIMPGSHSRHRSLNNVSGEGLTYFSAFYTMSMGFTFALFGAIFSQVICFNGKDLVSIFLAKLAGHQMDGADIHTKLMRRYPAVPLRWGAIMFLVTNLVAIVNLVVYKDQLEMRWWGILLATIVGGVMVIPIGILVATTNQVPNLGIVSQYLIGIISSGEPVTNVVFRTYSTVISGRTSNYLGNFKMGHYMKIPPRATFHALLMSTFISALVSTTVALWLTTSISDICDTSKLPRNTPWTCPQDRVFYDQVVTFGLVGARRLFLESGAPYRTLNFYFLAGFLVPVLVWMMRKALPGRRWVLLINAPLIIRGGSLMPPSAVVNNVMWIYVALFFSVYVFLYHKKWWRRYNYPLSAALDAGTVAMALLLYYSLDSGKETLSWWGERANGDHCRLASCPTGHGVKAPGCPVYS